MKVRIPIAGVEYDYNANITRHCNPQRIIRHFCEVGKKDSWPEEKYYERDPLREWLEDIKCSLHYCSNRKCIDNFVTKYFTKINNSLNTDIYTTKYVFNIFNSKDTVKINEFINLLENNLTKDESNDIIFNNPDINLNLIDKNGWTPLHYSCKNKFFKCFDYMIRIS